MQNLYLEVNALDKRCYENFSLTEDILMEHAAEGMAQFIRKNFAQKSSVFILCGAGNNGADGITLARLLHGEFDVKVMLPYGAKSAMAQLQKKRADLLDVKFIERIEDADIIVDALFGSGLSRDFDSKTTQLIDALNKCSGYKIACDMPSGIKVEGACEKNTFKADTTITMGALKRNMFLDEAKDFTGAIVVADLGITRTLYEIPSNYKLLEKSDLNLPHRTQQDTHKGSFGHLSVICGEKQGAAIIASEAALHFGAGLVTLVSHENVQTPYEIMQAHTLPSNTTTIALGMGLGSEYSTDELKNILNNSLPLVLDADIFYHPLFTTLLERKNVVLTPHPKEFIHVLKVTNIADIDISELQACRFKYVELFHKAYPDITLLLKGANVIIASKGNYFINTFGDSRLAKGGSGDVLAGLIAALLAQGYSTQDAAINGSLAHTLWLEKYEKSSYALTPYDIIEGVSRL